MLLISLFKFTTSLSNVTLTHRTSKVVNPSTYDSLVVLGAFNFFIYSVCTKKCSSTLVCGNKLVIFHINELLCVNNVHFLGLFDVLLCGLGLFILRCI